MFVGKAMLQNLRIASPCSADWDRMTGDDRVRYCPECKLSVYNFSAMTDSEAKRIVARREGRLCARFYQRTDGTLLTRNCPVGLRRAVLRVSRVATAALTVVLSVSSVSAIPASQRVAPLLLLQIKAAHADFLLQVNDPTGASMADVPVTLVNEATQEKFEAKTDESGRMRLTGFAKGSYDLTIAAPGFRAFHEAHVGIPKRDVMTVTLFVSGLMGEVIEIRQPNLLHRFASGLRHIF